MEDWGNCHSGPKDVGKDRVTVHHTARTPAVHLRSINDVLSVISDTLSPSLPRCPSLEDELNGHPSGCGSGRGQSLSIILCCHFQEDRWGPKMLDP